MFSEKQKLLRLDFYLLWWFNTQYKISWCINEHLICYINIWKNCGELLLNNLENPLVNSFLRFFFRKNFWMQLFYAPISWWKSFINCHEVATLKQCLSWYLYPFCETEDSLIHKILLNALGLRNVTTVKLLAFYNIPFDLYRQSPLLYNRKSKQDIRCFQPGVAGFSWNMLEDLLSKICHL